VELDDLLDLLEVVALQFEAVPERLGAERLAGVRRIVERDAPAFERFFVAVGLFGYFLVEPVDLLEVIRGQRVDLVVDFGAQVVLD